MTDSRDALASSPGTCPGQINWDYDALKSFYLWRPEFAYRDPAA
jgi:hypothetical protein